MFHAGGDVFAPTTFGKINSVQSTDHSVTASGNWRCGSTYGIPKRVLAFKDASQAGGFRAPDNRLNALSFPKSGCQDVFCCSASAVPAEIKIVREWK